MSEKSIKNYYKKLKDESITKFTELTCIDVKGIEDMTVSRFKDHTDFRCCTEASVCPKCYSQRSYEKSCRYNISKKYKRRLIIMATIYYESLSPQVKQKMKERAFTVEELKQLQEAIRKRHLEKMKGFKRATLIMIIVFVLLSVMTLMSVMKMPNTSMGVIAGALVFTALILVLVLVFLKFLANLVRNQFIKQIKRNYPEYAEQFGIDSFT